MIIKEDLGNGYVKIKSDKGNIIRESDGAEFSVAIVKEDAKITFTEAEG